MALLTWLKTQSARRQKKTYTSFRGDASPPPLSRKNAPRLHTPNYSSLSNPRPPSRSVSPGTTSHGTSEPASPIFSKRTSSISPHTTSPLTPPESLRSEEQFWITHSESSLGGNKGSGIRSSRDSASIGQAVLGESTPKRGRSRGGSRGRNTGAIPTPPQTPIPSSLMSGSGDDGGPDHDGDYRDGGVSVHARIVPGSDISHPPASRKEELVELFTQHGPVYGEEWRLRGAYDRIKKPGAPTRAEDIEQVNEELMNGYASGDEGHTSSEMWTLLLERGR